MAMPPTLANCESCGRLFARIVETPLCSECREQRDQEVLRIEKVLERAPGATAAQIARETGLDEERVAKLIQSSEVIAPAAEPIATCARCGARPADKGAQYCYLCRFDLINELNSAKGVLGRKLETMQHKSEAAVSRMSLFAALDAKRQRTGTNRFDPTPKQSKRYR